MPGRQLLFALLICLTAGAAAWAGPFTQVPGSDRAYGDWAFLAERELVTPPPGRVVSARETVTRTDFALALVPLARALAGLDDSPQGAAGLRRLAALGPDEMRQVGARMTSLLSQFQPELELMGLDTEAALAGAGRLETARRIGIEPPTVADGGTRRAHDMRAADSGAAGLRYRVSGAELGVTYGRSNLGRSPLVFLPAWALAGAPDPPATSRLAAGPLSDAYRSAELIVRSLRGSVEYDLTRSLSLGLAYEALLEGGDGMAPRDETSLKTVGLGYRLSPSTSLRLRYHLLDYRERLASAGWQRDEVAETELVIRF